MKKYTKESIIESIQRFYSENGRNPICRDFDTNPEYPNHVTVMKHFGKWSTAITLAGLKAVTRTNYSKEDVIISIQNFYYLNNKVPVAEDFRENTKYPNCATVRRHFKNWNAAIEAAGFEIVNKSTKKPYSDYSKEGIILAIQKFHAKYNRIPTTRDFMDNPEYPSNGTVQKYFTKWNSAIEAAGFSINTSKFGTHTFGLDGYLYRSQAEAYFVDTYLFSKFKYDVEPKYPYPHYRFYDWYIPELDLYIELDGGIRPEITKQKIEINKRLNRHCLFINTSEINKFKSLEDFIAKEHKLHSPENSNE